MKPFRSSVLTLIACAFFVGGCAETQFLISTTKRLQDQDTATLGNYKVGTPYQIKGTWYYPAEDWSYDETGIASWYGPNFHGKDTANGETYDMNALTAAHRTLPMPSFVRVVNLENGRALVLRINDRGPFAKGRIIDVSRRGAQLLGFKEQGTAKVRVQILAERSQAIKASILGGEQIAREGSPIKVDKLPKASVSTTELAPPPGASGPADTVVVARSTDEPVPVAQAPTTSALETTPSAQPIAEEVTRVAVAPTDIFVQAGAFTNYQNALRTKLVVGRTVPAEISHALIDNRDFYRVRVGPLKSIQAADRALEQVQRAGYPGARIIVAGKSTGQ